MISPMNSAELQDFVDNRMRMSHVYQPLLIRCLLDAGGQATLRQLAIEFAKEDEAQLRDYEKRIRGNDVIDSDSAQVSGCTTHPQHRPRRGAYN